MKMNRRNVLALAGAATGAAVLSPAPAFAAPKPDLWAFWQVDNPGNPDGIDHSSWDTFLSRNVEINNLDPTLIRYDGVSGSDRALLDTYLDQLAAVQIRQFSKPEQMAFWINLYNALTVKVILNHFPVRSIRDVDISPGFFSNGPWGKKLLAVEGEMLSLDDIEHRILRPIWQDPRIHYAVNCAALGCPMLMPRAFEAKDLEEDLNQNAIAFANSERGAMIDADDPGKIRVSSIFEWFKVDFGGTDRAVLDHIAAFAVPERASALMNAKRIDDDFYDWTLNIAT